MTKEEFWEYIHKPDIVRQDYIVTIRMRYSDHCEWEYTNELLTLNEDNPFYFIWDNDWWEGEKFVEILGYISIDDVTVPHNLQEKSPCVARECKQGEWIFTKKIFDKYGCTVECFSCHKKWKTYDEIRWKKENKFCPNCGEDMRGNENEVD